MVMKAHKLTKADIKWIKNTGQGGRKGYLKQILPLQQDGQPLTNPGPKTAQELHTTPQTRKQYGIKKGYFVFEVMLENNKAGFFFWTDDEYMSKKIMETYRTCYPSIGFRDMQEKFFVDLEPNDYVICARLTPKHYRYLPINIVPNGELWLSILSQIKSGDPYDKGVIQIILWPRKRSKMNKLQHRVWRRKNVKNPTEKYAELTNLWDAKTHMAPYEAVFRIVMFGRDPERLKRKMGDVLDVFNRLDSDAGGNRIKRKTYNTRQVGFLNSVEDRDVSHFIGPFEERFILSADEIGHNFFAVPVGEEVDILPVMDSMKVERMPIPEELIQHSNQTLSDMDIDKKYMVNLRYDSVMNDEELKEETRLYEQRQKENEEKACVLDAESEAYFSKLNQRLLDVMKKMEKKKQDETKKKTEETKENMGGVA